MKTLRALLFAAISLFSPFALASEGETSSNCTAAVNGEAVKLERSQAGFLIISLEDPFFDVFDVMINDLGNSHQVHFRLAHFVPTDLVGDLKRLVENVDAKIKDEAAHILKARVVDLTVGYDSTGTARAEFSQGERKLTALCHRSL